MTTLLPTSQSTGVEAYDEMFKEIHRKLYGDESAHGLYPHNTQVAQLAPGAPTAPPDGGERSFTTLTQIGYETTTVGAGSAAASGESASQQQSGSGSAASTAFGLAALMQNGFPPPGAILNPVNFAPGTSKTPTNISTPSSDNRWQSQHASDESWNAGKHSSASGGYGGKSYKKPKTEPQDGGSSSLNIPSTADRTSKGASGYGTGAAQGTTSSSSSAGTPQAYKRYSCTTCPYTTDRRDLFTRHENIHKDEKPFQCYACLKPFNRADHVKKHFLRMHRELEYDIAKTRRYPPSSSSASNASNKSAYYGHASQSANGGGTSTSTAAINSTSTTAAQPPMQLNIPSANFGTSSAHSLTIPTNVHESVSAQHHLAMSGINGGHSAGQLLQLHNLHHQQQQQQQQHNVHHHSISIKQEKGLVSGSSSHNTSASSAGGSPDEKSFVKKIKGEKKFSCTFCPWAGTDNWGLKRHLNTHTKPYVCLLCDYKAARSERLATHVLKVHNKKACGKCSFFAEDQAHLDAHLQEAHPHDPTKASKHAGTASGGGGGNCDTGPTHHSAGAAAPNGNVLRNLGNAFTSNNLPTNIPTSGNGFGSGSSANGHYHTAGGHHAATGNVLTNSNAANLIDTINQHLASAGPNGSNGNAAIASSLQHHQQQQQLQQHWMGKPHRKRNGAELLYSYLEADGSDSGDYARLLHMQAVGRNKASVTQDFHNAGGGDNGINGDHHSSSNGSGSIIHGAPANALFAVATADRLKKEAPDGANIATGSGQALAKASDSVALSLASLLGGDQLSFLQLLATAAVAHQQLQLHSGQQPAPYSHGGQQKKQQQQQQQQHHQSQPKPSKAAAVHQAVVGAPNGDRYGSMVSSPPATGTHQQHSRPAATASSTSTKNSSNSTNGTSIIIPSAPPASTSGTAITNSPMSTTAAVYATEPGGGAGFKKRRLNGSSSSDKENLMHRKGHAAGANLQVAASSVSSNIIVNGGGAIVNGGSNIVAGHHHSGGSKIGHNHHHNHHHNNNNTSTSNKNINDIFDKVYKKPQNSFVSSKQQQQQQLTPPAAHALPPSLLRIAPPSAVEEETNRYPCPVVIETEGRQFSLTEFLKNHTEVSISTVEAGAKDSEENDPAVPSDKTANDSSAPVVVSVASKEKKSPAVAPPKKRKSEGERHPRKQQQPRRFDDSDGDTLPVKLVPEEKPVPKMEPTDLAEPAEENEEENTIAKLDHCDAVETSGSSDESCVSRLADIRDKHMTQLVSRRRCCRICQNQGRLDHLDNHHYHSKISLILHTRWRHGCDAGSQELRCRQCDSQFRQRYKLALHKRLTHHAVSPAGRKKYQKKPKVGSSEIGEGKRSNGKENLTTNCTHTNGALAVKCSSEQKKSSAIGRKKQRKRKPRSRCFTPRRKK